MRAFALTTSLALAFSFVAPLAAAVDVLPTEVRFDRLEARILVRSASGAVDVRTEPPVLAGGVAPGGDADALATTPRAIEAAHVWRGIDGIVEVILQREKPTQAVDIIIEDGARTGVWLEWPPHARGIPAPFAALALLLAGRMWPRAR